MSQASEPRNAFQVLMAGTAKKNSLAVKAKPVAKSPRGRSAGQQHGTASRSSLVAASTSTPAREPGHQTQLAAPVTSEGAGATPGDAADEAGGPMGEADQQDASAAPSTSGRSGEEPPVKRPRLQDLFAKPTAKTFSRQVHDLLLVLDLEATCTKRRDLFPIEIIELSAVLLDAHTLAAVGEFQAYVRPTEHPVLDPFCVELTGIEQHQVDSAPLLVEALERLQRWLEALGALPARPDRSLLPVTWTDWDLKVCLETECEWRKLPRPPYLRRWCNLKRLFTQRYKRTSNLRACVESLGLEWRGRAHSGLDDSRNTAALVAKMARDGAVLRVTDSFKEQAPPQQAPAGRAQGQQQQGQQGQGQGQQGQGQVATGGEAAGAGAAADAGEGDGPGSGAAAAAEAAGGTPTQADQAAAMLLDPGEHQHGTPGGGESGAGGDGGGLRAAGGFGKGSAGKGGAGKGAGLRQTVLSLTPRKPQLPQQPGADSSASPPPAADGATAAAAAAAGTEPGTGGGGADGAAVASLAAVLPSAATAPPLYDSAGRWLGRCRCGVAARSRTVKKPGQNLGRHFYSCGRWTLTDRSRQCDFFAFSDSLQLAPGAAPAGGRGRGGWGGGTRR